jgi:hypothetical protein
LHSAPLAGVTLVLRNQATGAEARTSTSKNGVFRFRSLDAASYTLDADAAKLGHGRLEGIVVTGGIESCVQAAMVFDPAPPALIQASAPPQISGTPATIATMPRAAMPQIAPPQTTPSSFASVPAPSFATSAPTVAPNPPTSLPRPALNTTSPQLIASIPLVVPSDAEQLRPLPLKASTPAIASKPSAVLTPPMQTPPQFIAQPEASTQIAPPAAALPVFAPTVAAPPVTVLSSAPTTTPASPTVAASPSELAVPSAPQYTQPQPRRLVLPQRPALETQSAAMQLALSIAPQRPFQLKAAATSVLAATATLPPSIVQAALLNPPPVAATIAAVQPPDPVTPAVATTITAAQLQALPASGRQWQAFLLDTPAAGASADGSQASFRGSQQSAGITVDGVDTRLAFGVSAGSAVSRSSGDEPDPERSTSSSSSQTWAGALGLRVSEAAIREVTTAAGNVEAEDMRSAGGRTSIRTESGGNAVHGQGFFFDRQNTWGAQNPFTQWVTETSEFAPLTRFNTVLFPVFDNFQYSSGQSGSPESYTPPDHETVWGVGLGSDIRRNKLFWFAALDSNHRNDSGLAMVRHPYLQPPCETSPCSPTGFFAAPSDAQLELLSAQLDPSSANPEVEGLTAYSQMLAALAGLLGPAPRSSAQWVGFARIDWQATERHRFTLEGIGSDLNSPGGGLTGVSENYGNHSFGSSQASQQWLLARWESYLTPNLLAVTQGSAGRVILSAKPDTPSTFEQAFLTVNAYGQLPQIVVDSRYGFTIGNPSRFGQGEYPDEHLYNGQEMLDWVHNKLMVKAGFELDHDADATSLLRNQTGTYTYSKVEDFISDAVVFQELGLQDPNNFSVQHSCGETGATLGSQPCYSYFSQTIGPSNWHLSTNDWAGFVTAQRQLSKVAVFSAGLRWEREELPPPIASVANLQLTSLASTGPAPPLSANLPSLGNNWGPRFSLALGAAQSHWPVLRLGYGMYYGRVENATIETALTQTGSLKGDLYFFMRPQDDCQHCSGGAPPFPYVFSGEPSSVVKPGIVGFVPNFRNPEIHQAVASIEESLPGHIELTAAAMLSLGRRLPVFIDANLAPTTQTITYTVCDQAPSGAGNGECGNLGLGPIKSPQITVPFYASSVGTGVAGWLDPDYQQIDQITSKANSTYEAAMVKLARYGRRGLNFRANYTYAHAMDWNPGESPLNAVDLSQEYGNSKIREYGTSDLDVRHSAVAMVIYEAPWKLHSVAGRLANGWILSGIGQFHSGLPYTMRVTGSLPEESISNGTIVGLRPGINGSGGDNRIYGMSSNGQVYNIGRNTFRYPNIWKADLRLGKKFDLGETRQLELLVESFNLFNHQNVTEIETTGYYIEPGSPYPTLNFLTGLKTNSTTGLPNPAFGQPLSINGTDFYRERQIQIGLHMRF